MIHHLLRSRHHHLHYRAVVWTDFIQFLLIICAVFAVITLGTFEIGSVSEVFAAANRGGRLKAFE